MQYGRVVPLFFPFEDEPCSTESWKVHPVDAKINYDYNAQFYAYNYNREYGGPI